jgi:hypothetical protein
MQAWTIPVMMPTEDWTALVVTGLVVTVLVVAGDVDEGRDDVLAEGEEVEVQAARNSTTAIIPARLSLRTMVISLQSPGATVSRMPDAGACPVTQHPQTASR